MSLVFSGANLQLGALMKPLVQFAFCCLLAPGLFAQHSGGGTAGGGSHGSSATAGHRGTQARASARNSGYGAYGGYGYGVFYGGDYVPFYEYGYNPPAGEVGPNVTIIYPSAAPPAMMMPETAHPVIHEYNQPSDYGAPPEPSDRPILYLIAFRDGTIRAAMAYWVEGGALHYLDTGHKERQAPLSSVDRDLSAQLNHERNVPFNIP